MRLLVTLAAAAAAASLASAANAFAGPAEPVSYRVSPVLEHGELRALAVDISFAGDPDGETRLDLPDEWAGASKLWGNLGNWSAEGATLEPVTGKVAVLHHAPGARVHIRYLVRAAHDREPEAEDGKGEPVVRPRWFTFMGEGMFAVPQGREKAPVRFDWGAFPKDWKVASDLDHLARTPGTVDDMVQSVALGGPDVTVRTYLVDGAPIRIALRGRWSFDEVKFADTVGRIARAENAFWGDKARPYVLVVTPLTGGVGGRSSLNGTGRGDGFAVSSTTNIDLLKETHFLAHEYGHTWIARALGGQPERDEALEYWFSEGFTDFYASRLLLRSGVWSLEDFVEKQNEVLARYWNSPARNTPMREGLGKAWDNQDLSQLPYDRGRLMATLWDDRLRRTSGGRLDLDDVMHAQLKAARTNKAAGKTVTGGALFVQTWRKVAGDDAAAEVERYSARGQDIVLPADLYGACAKVETITVPVFDRGFDGEASGRTGVITGVDPAGPAYSAGLRDGMKRLGREGGRDGDSRVEIGYRVSGPDGVERLVKYRPEGKARLNVQQVALAPDLTPERRAACARTMSGG